MKKIVTFTLVSITLLVSSLVFASNNHVEKVIGDNETYVLTLDANKKIVSSSTPSESETSSLVSTQYNNALSLNSFNVINYDGGWQTLLPGGYIYNPLTGNGFNNKISGLKSIKYTGNGQLELHYGYTLNNAEIIYSFEEALVANTKYEFSTNHPSYFYVKNNNGYSVNISNLEIEYSCVEESFPNSSLKVLMIGNSFADDTVFYSQRVASGFGINLEIYDAYIAGCTINTHYSNIQSGATSYSMRSMNGSNWNYQDNKSLSDIVRYKTWDIITFQQASAEIGRPDTYGNLSNLVDEVKAIAYGNPKYYWYQTWAYAQDYSEWYDYFSYFGNDQKVMFDAIVDCYNNQVAPLNIFEKSIFAGTAVQNLRSSYMKDTLSRDGKHMSNVHGRYLLACNFISNIFGIDLDLSPVSYLPEGVHRSFLTVVNESIRNARKNPDVITNSAYPVGEMGDYDLSDYTEIDAGLVGCSYYNCQDSSNWTGRLNHTDGTSNKYVSTYRFTKDTLPVGSLVFKQEGFGYRPEAWVDDNMQSTRVGERYDNVLEITENFWSGYQYRAFNIFKAGKISLSGEYNDEQYDEIFDGFHIFVPNSKMGGLNPKTYNPYYSSDMYLFQNNGLNIDNYLRVHLDPITGFYKCDSYYYLMNSYRDDTAQKFVCTRPFYSASNDLPVGSVIIVDSGFQWRSDCWKDKETYPTRPGNVSTNFTIVNSSFMSGFRRRTFNVSSTSMQYVRQNSIVFMNHLRIYTPII